MTRLQSELQRLYLPHANADANADRSPFTGPGADGPVRVLMLGLARPADWELLSRVWRGVQADLELPAPAIAVSGSDGFQLWFSLARPVAQPEARRFLAGLRQRYWPELGARRVSQWPAADAADASDTTEMQELAWPGHQVQPEQWSAFVSPDLAPVFAETPWLDIAPVDDGQAQLLRDLLPIAPADWAAALAALWPEAPAAGHRDPVPTAPPASTSPAGLPAPAAPAAPAQREPRQFLLDVMNDPAVDLSLRIEAARALLSAPAS